MFNLKKLGVGLCLALLVTVSALAEVVQIGKVLVRETLPGMGRLPTIAVDFNNNPHVMADGGIGTSKAYISVFDRKSDGTWANTSFDSYNRFGGTQFFNPHLEITEDGKGFCGAIVFGRAIGMGTIMRTGMNTDTPSSPTDGYSVRRIQGPWDAGETSVDFNVYDQFVISSSFGRARIYTFDAAAWGLIRELEFRQMFAGNGGEKNAFWISKNNPMQHRFSGTHGVWHGATGGYVAYDSSYQNSVRHEEGKGTIAWAAYWRYPFMQDDGVYVDVKSDNVDPLRAYMSSDFKHDGGVCMNIYNPDTDSMVYDIGNLPPVDAGGSSGLRRFAPQLAAAKDGGCFITWTSWRNNANSVYVRYVSQTGEMGPEYWVGYGERSNICVDYNGDLHIAYSNGNMQYAKLDVLTSDPDDILLMMAAAFPVPVVTTTVAATTTTTTTAVRP